MNESINYKKVMDTTCSRDNMILVDLMQKEENKGRTVSRTVQEANRLAQHFYDNANHYKE